MKKIIWLVALLFVATVSAELQISPSSFTMSSSLNQEVTKEITFTNLHNFTIYNLSFTENTYLSYPVIDRIDFNQTKVGIIKFKSSTPLTSTYNIITRFTFFTDVLIPSKNYNISINNMSFEPMSITISKGDSITWFNNDSILHTVTSSDFDRSIQPNQTTTVTFNDIKTINYQDNNVGLLGSINIINKSQELTNNPNFNKIMTITVDADYDNTDITLNPYKSNFTIRYNQTDESVLQIKNTGNNDAVNVTLTADKWITFSENFFNLPKNSERFVIFKIKPSITTINDTNRDYSLNIKSSSINAGEKNSLIRVFVPNEQYIESYANLSREELIAQINSLKNVLISMNLTSGVTEKVIYLEPTVGINYTEQDILEDKRRLTSIETSLETSRKFTNDEINSIKSTLFSMSEVLLRLENITNSSLALSTTTQDEMENSKKFTSLLVDVFLLLAVVGAISFYMINYLRKKRELET